MSGGRTEDETKLYEWDERDEVVAAGSSCPMPLSWACSEMEQACTECDRRPLPFCIEKIPRLGADNCT
jgi:hypothetical protein